MLTSFNNSQNHWIRRAGWAFFLAFLCTLVGARVLASSQEAGQEDSGLDEDPVHLSDRILNYRIEVGLDPLEKKVAGHEILTWRNPSGQAL